MKTSYTYQNKNIKLMFNVYVKGKRIIVEGKAWKIIINDTTEYERFLVNHNYDWLTLTLRTNVDEERTYANHLNPIISVPINYVTTFILFIKSKGKMIKQEITKTLRETFEYVYYKSEELKEYSQI